MLNLYTNTLEECEKLRCIIVGGEVINKDSAILLLNKLKNANIANAYGMVETTAVCCLQYGRDLKILTLLEHLYRGWSWNKEYGWWWERWNLDKDKSFYERILSGINILMNGYDTGDRGYKNREGLLFVTGRDSMSINKGGIKN